MKKVNNEKLLSLLRRNSYGWTYPIIKSNASLKKIAELARASDEYKIFSYYSDLVHSNNALQVLRSINWSENTFEHCTRIALILQQYLIVLSKHCLYNANFRMLNSLIQKIFFKYNLYEKRRKKVLSELNNFDENS